MARDRRVEQVAMAAAETETMPVVVPTTEVTLAERERTTASTVQPEQAVAESQRLVKMPLPPVLARHRVERVEQDSRLPYRAHRLLTQAAAAGLDDSRPVSEVQAAAVRVETVAARVQQAQRIPVVVVVVGTAVRAGRALSF